MFYPRMFIVLSIARNVRMFECLHSDEAPYIFPQDCMCCGRPDQANIFQGPEIVARKSILLIENWLPIFFAQSFTPIVILFQPASQVKTKLSVLFWFCYDLAQTLTSLLRAFLLVQRRKFHGRILQGIFLTSELAP